MRALLFSVKLTDAGCSDRRRSAAIAAVTAANLRVSSPVAPVSPGARRAGTAHVGRHLDVDEKVSSLTTDLLSTSARATRAIDDVFPGDVGSPGSWTRTDRTFWREMGSATPSSFSGARSLARCRTASAAVSAGVVSVRCRLRDAGPRSSRFDPAAVCGMRRPGVGYTLDRTGLGQLRTLPTYRVLGLSSRAAHSVSGLEVQRSVGLHAQPRSCRPSDPAQLNPVGQPWGKGRPHATPR